MAAVEVGVQVVRVDVEGDEANGRERRRVDDGHVIGGVDADGGHVGACAGAHVGDPFLDKRRNDEGRPCGLPGTLMFSFHALCVCACHLEHSPPDLQHHVVVVETLQQPESVSSSYKTQAKLLSEHKGMTADFCLLTYKNALSLPDSINGVRGLMNTVNLVSCRDQSRRSAGSYRAVLQFLTPSGRLECTRDTTETRCVQCEAGQTQSLELVPGCLGVGVSVMESVGNKQNPLHVSATHSHHIFRLLPGI